jgi:hypothetical protein
VVASTKITRVPDGSKALDGTNQQIPVTCRTGN